MPCRSFAKWAIVIAFIPAIPLDARCDSYAFSLGPQKAISTGSSCFTFHTLPHYAKMNLHINIDRLKQMVSSISWFHFIEIVPGVYTHPDGPHWDERKIIGGNGVLQAGSYDGAQPNRWAPTNGPSDNALVAMRTHQANMDLVFPPKVVLGKSVIDIGSYNGQWAFAAEERGASRVMAVDSYCWKIGKVSGAKEADRTSNDKSACQPKGFHIIRAAKRSKVEAAVIDFYDISPENVGHFDVVNYLGVLYHEPHPYKCLEIMANITNKVLIVDTHLDFDDLDVPAMGFYPGFELKGDYNNWNGINTVLLTSMLKGLGFEKVVVTAKQHYPASDNAGFSAVCNHPGRCGRILVHAWRANSE